MATKTLQQNRRNPTVIHVHLCLRLAASVRVRQTKILIDGQWTNSVSGRTFETINPATGEVIANVAEAGPISTRRQGRTARVRERPWRKANARDAAGCYKLADLIDDNRRARRAWKRSTTASRQRCAPADLPLAIACYRYYAGWADKIQGKTIPIRPLFLLHAP